MAQTLKGRSAAVWKLLSSASLDDIRQGLALAASAGEPQVFDDLLAGVAVDEGTGTLIAGERFGKPKTRKYERFVALVGLLAGAPEGSRGSALRASIRMLEANLPWLPDLCGFTGLETVRITVRGGPSAFETGRFGALPNLKLLEIGREERAQVSDGTTYLDSLRDLDAPQLETVRLDYLGLREITALARSPRLKLAGLSGNPDLAGIDPLAPSRHTLKTIDLSGCKSIRLLEPFSHFSNLASLNVSDCANLDSLEGLPGTSTMSIGMFGCHGLRSLDGIEHASPIKFTASDSLTGLTDASALGRCTQLTEARIESPNVVVMPESWRAPLRALTVSKCERLTSLGGLGGLGRSLEVLEVFRCPLLGSLAPSEPLAALRHLEVGPQILDFGSLAHGHQFLLEVRLDEKVPPEFPAGLSRFDALRLKLQAHSGADISFIEALDNVTELDVQICYTTLPIPPLRNHKALRCFEVVDMCLGFSGSFRFLEGCTSLEELTIDRCYSPTDVDVLLSLPKLRIVRLSRGSMHRAEWPAELQERLRYV